MLASENRPLQFKLMRLKRRALLLESPAAATSDIAFNLIVFFLVCASVQPDTGREQLIPKVDEQKEKSRQSQNIEVSLTPKIIIVNGEPVPLEKLTSRLTSLLAGKNKPEDKVVLVKSDQATPYQRWIQVTGLVESAGGTITLRLEETKTTTVN